jgi:hypothetical protein
VFLRRLGFGVVYLGQNTPATRLQDMLDAVKPDMVLISATQLRAAANLLAMFESLKVGKPGAQVGGAAQPIFAFGGHIFNQIPSLRDRVSGVYVGGSAVEAAQRINQIINRRELVPMLRPVPPRAAARELTDALRKRRPELISMASRQIMGNSFEFNTVAQKHERVIDTCERLFNILDAGVYFDDPNVLADATYWEWDSLTPEGVMPEQLQICATEFISAIRHALAAPHREVVEPFLAELSAALHM